MVRFSSFEPLVEVDFLQLKQVFGFQPGNFANLAGVTVKAFEQVSQENEGIPMRVPYNIGAGKSKKRSGILDLVFMFKTKLSNREMIVRRIFTILVLYWFIGFFIGISLFYYGQKGLLIFILAGTSILLLPLKIWLDELGNRIDGLKGEYKVSIALSQMWQEGVRYVDDLMLDPQKRGNIDHIAITKNGVWVIETKYQDGEITMANGKLLRNGKPFFRNKDYLFQVKAQARDVEDLLREKKYKNVSVRSVIVFAGPYSKVRFGVRPKEGVFLVGSQGLRKLILEARHEGFLSVQEIDSLKTFFEKYQAD